MLPGLGRMGCLVLLGRLDDPLQFARPFGPHKRSVMLVIVSNVLYEKILQLTLRLMNALGQSLASENAEEALDEIHPGGMGRDIVEVYARMTL